MSWHTPCTAEIDFAVQLFRELVEPTLEKLEALLNERASILNVEKPKVAEKRYTAAGSTRSGIWRNDFCRHLTFVRNAFAGTPTLVRFEFNDKQFREACESSDILYVHAATSLLVVII